MRALAWRGPEALAASGFAAAQLAAVRTACSAAFGRSVDWDSVPTAAAGDPHGDARPFGPLGKLLLGGGCLVVVLAVSVVWVYGFVHLFGLFDG
ncbi:DUF6584 family protein [Streptomyces liangshanensis]|uniref:DUF6584 family protein n=1 Tax=Streptomyces liangshanensis TaxID=2717324 RepID=UPI0036DB6F68